MSSPDQELRELLAQDEETILQSLLNGNYKAEDFHQIQELEWLGQNRPRVLAAIVQLKRDISG